MKKILYSILVAGLVLTGCTNFDSEVSRNYDAGPSVAINLTATADSTFIFTVTPASGTQYYSYLVVKSATVQACDSVKLLKSQYAGVTKGVLNAASNATCTVNMRDAKKTPLCLPNTSYVVYAVAANDKGMIGKVTTQVVKTTDGVAPSYSKFTADKDNKSVAITFLESIGAGSGKVSAQYYEEYAGKFVDIDPANITTTISSNVVNVSTPKVPSGAIVLISWEAGAFKDLSGNSCAALSSGINAAGTGFKGIYYQATKKNVTLPAKSFTDNGKVVSSFAGTANFSFNVYRNDQDVSAGDVSLVYKTATKTSIYALTANQWSVNGKQLSFTIPEAPNNATLVGLSIKPGTIFDDLGNPNAELTTDSVYWNYLKYMAYHLYPHTAQGYYNFGNFTISSGSVPGSIILNNFYLADSQLAGYLDLANGKLFVENEAVLGFVSDVDDNNNPINYGILTYDRSNSKNNYIEFDFSPTNDNFVSSSFALVYSDEAVTQLLGYWIKPDQTLFTPYVPPTASRVAMSSYKYYGVAKTLKGQVAPNKIIKR